MPLVLALLFLLLGCAAPRAKAAAGPPATPSAERLHYRASLPVVPAGASSVVLSVRLDSAAKDARPVEAQAFVGNGLLVCPLSSPAERTTPFASLRWAAASKSDARELRLETHGKPLELVLELERELARTPQSDDSDTLEHALVLGTSALVDGKPFEGVVTRLERAPTASARP